MYRSQQQDISDGEGSMSGMFADFERGMTMQRNCIVGCDGFRRLRNENQSTEEIQDADE